MTGRATLNKLTLHQELRGRKDLKSVHRDVLQALASYGSYDLTSIKPSVERICTDYGLAVNTVRAAIRHCRERGYLIQVRPGVGRGNPTEYTIVIPVENPPKIGGLSLEETNAKPPTVEDENPPTLDVKPPKVCVKTPHGLDTNQVETSSSPVKSNQGDADASEDFEIWFRTYPRREQKALAKAAYAEAVKKDSPSVLLAGLQKYKTAMQNTEPRYIKLPANWLKEERWRDYDMVLHHDWVLGDRWMTRAEKAGLNAKNSGKGQRPTWWHS